MVENQVELEVADRLQKMYLEGTLERSIALLNITRPNICEKRGESQEIDGQVQQSCRGCVTQGIGRKGAYASLEQLTGIIDYFAQTWGARVLAIPGQGNPLHPALAQDTMALLEYAFNTYGMIGYTFNAVDNLTEENCRRLADAQVNVMVSLKGNQFIDAPFFHDHPRYSPPTRKGEQDRPRIAEELNRFLDIYGDHPDQPAEGLTRIGFNYVVGPSDVADQGAKLDRLSKAIRARGYWFGVNTPFERNEDQGVQARLEALQREYVDRPHSLAIKTSDGVHQCALGNTWTATVGPFGELYQCPYMGGMQTDGLFQKVLNDGPDAMSGLMRRYMAPKDTPCIMRPHQR
ncbi:hypothetical protein COY28_00625 [Candidatus Woesearchaeota archaeon CG_4_10_14_0_2_um_filter_57_5]|nr:MAG: hypothetical protein AUJ68_02195 [Candidatus Woesearchaeota archaeon CG1_02_57_44]PIZ56865.1 MAG: hypothetical protein COY28_00625 [Candidatus Woesearchaeota archaeon CG_4_10_14_0_2_um_filter_57_5]